MLFTLYVIDGSKERTPTTPNRKISFTSWHRWEIPGNFSCRRAIVMWAMWHVVLKPYAVTEFSVLSSNRYDDDFSSTNCTPHSYFLWVHYYFENCPWIFISPYSAILLTCWRSHVEMGFMAKEVFVGSLCWSIMRLKKSRRAQNKFLF